VWAVRKERFLITWYDVVIQIAVAVIIAVLMGEHGVDFVYMLIALPLMGLGMVGIVRIVIRRYFK
jgi:hypothetical protein